MTDRPIIFSDPMIEALLAGRKTQTRRILKPQPYPLEGRPGFWNASGSVGGRICISDAHLLELHRWKVGDQFHAVQIRPITFGDGRFGVGDDGNVYDIGGLIPKRRKVGIGPKGYEEISLRYHGKQKRFRVNRLVAEAFYGPPPSPKHVCRHLDSVRRNNDPLNLDWGTAAQNSADGSAAGSFSGEKGSQARLSDIDVEAIRTSKEPQSVVADRYGITQPTVSKIRSGTRRRTKHPAAPPPNLPREHRRLTLVVTEVRVERLQDISEADALAEGVHVQRVAEWAAEGTYVGKDNRPILMAVDDPSTLYLAHADADAAWAKPSEAFADLWASINGPESWAANPWVAAISFTVHHSNIDALPSAEAA